MSKTSERLEQIKRAHMSARPNPAANPAWANTHRDLGFCLSLLEAQAKAIEEMRGSLKHARHVMWEHGFTEDELQPIRKALASHSKGGEG